MRLKDRLKKNKFMRQLNNKRKEVLKNEDDILYLKLSFKDNKKYYGKDLEIYENGKIVWGTKLEAPQKGFPIQYRNIIVNDPDIENYSNNLGIKMDMSLSNNRFYTNQQRDYNKKFDVQESSDGLFYSISGNTKNPKKILYTFPGFGKSTSRIPYAISAMGFLKKNKQINDNYMIVAFQDRYYVLGNYMTVDDSGNELYPKFVNLVQKQLKQYNLKERDMVLFGASKGASIALRYAEEFKNALLILSVPQIELNYYFRRKPFFKNNLYLNYKDKITDNLKGLLELYIKENRRIHYFYTDNDELSNYGIIENIIPDNFNKYRIDGAHGEVTRKVMNTFESLIFDEIVDQKPIDIHPELKKIEKADDKYLFQIYIPEFSKMDRIQGNAYIRSGSVFQIISHNALANGYFISNRNQYLRIFDDEIDDYLTFVFIDENNNVYSGDFKVQRDLKFISDKKGYINVLAEGSKQTYYITNKYVTQRVKYELCINSDELIITDRKIDFTDQNSQLYIRNVKDIDTSNLSIFINRVQMQYGFKRIIIDFEKASFLGKFDIDTTLIVNEIDFETYQKYEKINVEILKNKKEYI